METTTRVRLRSNTGQKTADGKNIRTEAWITYNWEGITQEELDRLATDQVKILTSHYYKERQIVPEGEISLNVRDVMPGQRKSRKPAIEKFSKEELLAQLKRLGVEV